MEGALIAMTMTLTMLLWPPSLAVQSAFYTRVLVSEAKITGSQLLEPVLMTLGSSHTLRCSLICSLQSWCDLWCSDASTDQCLLSNMIVLPNYEEDSTTDALVCYTQRRKDYATGATIQTATVYYTAPLRVGGNLVDGIYDRFTLNACFTSANDVTNPWFVLDFGAPVSLRSVTLFSQPSGQTYMPTYLANLEVRVGMSPVATLGDFSSYAFFGIFIGPASSFSQEIVIEATSPMTARFLSLQKISGTGHIQICHLEVR
ncbi:uncharacterized protein LOC134778815 [Penaeus indicus]|uniref:uncharacterized protein LOC134778815 n=1 Tax=Penaeus indicus TaxID=29960 RepID=UPI00300C71FC